MNVDSILISEYAALTDGGMLTIFRTFNGITSDQAPASIPMMFITLIMHGHSREGGTEHDVELRVVNSRREVIGIASRGSFKFPPSETADPGMPLRHTHVAGLFNPSFDEAGPYAFEVYIDGTYHAGAAFYVRIGQ